MTVSAWAAISETGLAEMGSGVEDARAVHVDLESALVRVAADVIDGFRGVDRTARHVMRIFDLDQRSGSVVGAEAAQVFLDSIPGENAVFGVDGTDKAA